MQYLKYRGKDYVPFNWSSGWIQISAQSLGCEPTLQGWFEYVLKYNGPNAKVALVDEADDKRVLVRATLRAVKLITKPITRVKYIGR